ncbi:MAG: IclR family transcriptional regulator [Eubacteriaceae bacterium]|jgi:DNA-binding IclR family transcriptional regulator|nr:IclR family transcriptional regulator [Eubacteriaceae bacterium]
MAKKMSDNTSESSNGVQSVERALTLLQIIAKATAPISISEICDISGLNRTTAWRLLLTLEKCDYVERDPVTKNYELSMAFTNVGLHLTEQYAPLIRIAHPSMARICDLTRESVLLAVPRFFGTLTIFQLDPPQSVRLKNYTNTESSLVHSSTGKIVLANLPENELEAIIKSYIHDDPEDVQFDIDAFKADIRRVRAKGYSFVFEEFDKSENAVSVPIYKGRNLSAILNVGGPSSRFTKDVMNNILPNLLEEAEIISSMLTY